MNFFAMFRSSFFAPGEEDKGVAKLGFLLLMLSAIMSCFARFFRIRDRDSIHLAPNRHNFGECQKLRDGFQKAENLERLLEERNSELESSRKEIETLKVERVNLEKRIDEMQVDIRGKDAELDEVRKLVSERDNTILNLGKLLSKKQDVCKLTDDRQTPGTVFPAHSNNVADGKANKETYGNSSDSSDEDFDPSAPVQDQDEPVNQDNSSSDFSSDSEDLSALLEDDDSGHGATDYKEENSTVGRTKGQSLNDELSYFMETSTEPISDKRHVERPDYKKLHEAPPEIPIENPSIWKDLSNLDSESNPSREESFDQNDEEVLLPVSDTSVSNNPDVTTTTNNQFALISGEKVQLGRTPGDRQIAHWNNMDSSHVSPRWDGNGIPNSTSKYKEDQKVSWHATPFNVRLEKALSKETFVSERGRWFSTMTTLKI